MKRRSRLRDPQGNDSAALSILAGQLRPGDFVEVLVLHDDSCRFLRGRGACDCEPTVRAMTPRREAEGAEP